ncbi:uncharacterized protein N7469_006637 [Penicillium citrinum]|uniref:Uncharacterized protein n=1 Tax=Penicillium citrinum TaxID=5077 RepID=A0A9W9NVK0_PENCI|nr:uncharacterized protein N7469_006637 [Penicillium citrinum]KAJ5226631.1 hypothetical protein N7469_006637 [Penicillium citrinum]
MLSAIADNIIQKRYTTSTKNNIGYIKRRWKCSAKLHLGLRRRSRAADLNHIGNFGEAIVKGSPRGISDVNFGPDEF